LIGKTAPKSTSNGSDRLPITVTLLLIPIRMQGIQNLRGRTALRASGMSAPTVLSRDVDIDRAHVCISGRDRFSASPRASPVCRAGKGPVVVIDNYDSFTYNLCQVSSRPFAHATQYKLSSNAVCHAQYLGDLACDYVVLKNDEKTVDEIKAMNPRGVLVSPGPGNKRL